MSNSMAKYHDVPMDLADASLIAVAEQLGLRQVFSLDADFYVYRLADGTVLERVPYLVTPELGPTKSQPYLSHDEHRFTSITD